MILAEGEKMAVVSFQTMLENELKKLIKEGDFIAATLSDKSGLVLAMEGNSALTTTISALSSLSLGFKTAVQKETALFFIDEVSTVSENKYRYVNRYFEIDNEYFIISMIVPPNQAYRHLTNQAIVNLKKLFMNRAIQISRN